MLEDILGDYMNRQVKASKAVYVTDEDGTHVEILDEEGVPFMWMHPDDYANLSLLKENTGSYVWADEKT